MICWAWRVKSVIFLNELTRIYIYRSVNCNYLLHQTWYQQYQVPDSKAHWANMGPTWVLSAPGGPHVGPMNLAIRGAPLCSRTSQASIWCMTLHGYEVGNLHIILILVKYQANWKYRVKINTAIFVKAVVVILKNTINPVSNRYWCLQTILRPMIGSLRPSDTYLRW